MLIIPAIDLKEGRCVRLRQGLKNNSTVYAENPLEVAHRWQNEGAQMVHIVNLDGAFQDEDSKNLHMVEKIIQQARIPVQFGGGVRTLEQVVRLVSLGVTRIVLGTMAVEQPEFLIDLVEQFGDRIVVGIDARNGHVTTHGWETTTLITAFDLARRVAQAGVQRIVYTDISRDGMLSGPNFEMTRFMAEQSGLNVTASGGIASLEDISQLQKLTSSGVDSCIVGKALYEGCFTLGEAMSVGNRP